MKKKCCVLLFGLLLPCLPVQASSVFETVDVPSSVPVYEQEFLGSEVFDHVSIETGEEILPFEEITSEDSISVGWVTDEEGNRYYYDETGTPCTGLLRTEEGLFYFKPETGILKSGWRLLDGSWYFFNPAALTGLQKIGSCTYFFNEEGIMQTGFVNVNGTNRYFRPSNGSMRSGWLAVGDDWYYFDPEEAFGFKKIENFTYYFDENGIMQTGWLTLGKDVYYLNESGKRASGLTTINNNLYYFLPETGVLKKNWRNIDGNWYFFEPQALTGWQHIGNCDYYFNENGIMQTGWLTLGEDTYYLKTNGAKVSGLTVVDGTLRFFDTDGRLITPRATLDSVTNETTVTSWNPARPLSAQTLSAIETAIKGYGNYSVSFTLVDINTGQGLTYTPSTLLYSASAIKGPFEISVLNAGNKPTTYIYNTIKVSDNASYIYTRSLYGKTVFENWLTEAGVSSSQAATNYVGTTSLDLAKMWLHGWDFLSSNTSNASWARSVFQGVNYSALNLQLASSYTVYSKAGWIDYGGYYNVYNCAGIITDGKNPYVLAIMSNCSGTAGIPAMKKLAAALNK